MRKTSDGLVRIVLSFVFM